MPDKNENVSNAAVKKATGRTWPEWFALLDEAGAASKTHKEIVALVKAAGGAEGVWWQQTITVGYEKARGKRVLGETADAGFQVGVRKTLPVTVERAWDLLTKPAGRKLWLGTVARLRLEKGVTFETAEGARGEIRVVSAGTRLRLTWHPTMLQRESTVQVTVQGSGEKAAILFHQERLSDPAERAKMKAYWSTALDRLAALAGA